LEKIRDPGASSPLALLNESGHRDTAFTICLAGAIKKEKSCLPVAPRF
jgi:hypothetical protein